MDYTWAGLSSTKKHNLYQIFILFQKPPTFKKEPKISKTGSKKISLFILPFLSSTAAASSAWIQIASWSSHGLSWCPTCWWRPPSPPWCSWWPSTSACASCRPTLSGFVPQLHCNFLIYIELFFLPPVSSGTFFRRTTECKIFRFFMQATSESFCCRWWHYPPPMSISS